MAGLVVVGIAAAMLAGAIPNEVAPVWLWVLVAMGGISGVFGGESG